MRRGVVHELECLKVNRMTMRRKKNKILHDYVLHDTVLADTEADAYLGVELTSKLTSKIATSKKQPASDRKILITSY